MHSDLSTQGLLKFVLIPSCLYLIESLNVGNNNLDGKLPNISNLFRLEALHLQENEFTGTIPESIQQLQSIGTFQIRLAQILLPYVQYESH